MPFTASMFIANLKVTKNGHINNQICDTSSNWSEPPNRQKKKKSTLKIIFSHMFQWLIVWTTSHKYSLNRLPWSSQAQLAEYICDGTFQNLCNVQS